MSGYMLGIIVGWLITALTFTYLPGGKIYEANKLKDTCEVNLPRDQQCVMQFVPEQIKHE